MDVEVQPSHVPQQGLPPRAALALIVVAVASVAGIAILGRAPSGPAPAWSPAAAPESSRRPAASPTPSPGVAVATLEPCTVPRIGVLTSPIARHPRPLVATGLEVLTPWAGAEGSLVADAHAGFWAMGNGRLVRLDGRGAVTASWTVADDAVFSAWTLVAAREGGVWLWGGPTIAWFDGERLLDVVPAPSGGPGASWIVDVGEAPDGSLWAAVNSEVSSRSGIVFHWDGAAWMDACHTWPRLEIGQLAVDAGGGVWVAPVPAGREVSVFDGTAWSKPPADPAWVKYRSLPNSWSSGLVATPDGSLWMAQGALGHFDGTAWTGWQTQAVDLAMTISLAGAPDGSAWLVTGAVSLPGDEWGPHTGTAIARFDGRTWTIYDDADGLPAATASSWATVTAVAVSGQSVLAATREGFYRLAGDRWVLAGSRPAAAGPAWPQELLAVSAEEAWAAAEDGLWHFRDGAATKLPVAGWKAPLRVFDVATAPDGTLAVATERGAAVLRDGTWAVLDSMEAHFVDITSYGVIWVGKTGDAQTTIASFRFDGRSWMRSDLPAVATMGRPAALVRAPDGELWLLSEGWGREAHRFNGARWVPGVAPGLSPGNITDLVLAPDGDLLALVAGDSLADLGVARYDGATWTLQRAAGDLAQEGSGAGASGFAIAPDGSPWVATDRGLAHFNGQLWSLHVADVAFYNLSFAPDGTLWAVGPSGVQRLPADLLAEPDPAAR